MSFLERAIKNGISKGISNAVGNALKQAVEPKATAYANKVADELDQAAQNVSQQTNEAAQQTARTTGGLEGAFANLQQSMENYATQAAKNAAVLSKWAEKLPEYPVWNCGGTYYELEEGDNWIKFSVFFATEAEGERSIPAYRELLKANGFREAGQYPDKAHLYKKSGGICYHVDTEHCFEGSMNRPDIWFNNEEPYGGFDYVKPEPKKGFSFGDLFK